MLHPLLHFLRHRLPAHDLHPVHRAAQGYAGLQPPPPHRPAIPAVEEPASGSYVPLRGPLGRAPWCPIGVVTRLRLSYSPVLALPAVPTPTPEPRPPIAHSRPVHLLPPAPDVVLLPNAPLVAPIALSPVSRRLLRRRARGPAG